jgi:hypothetical protein
MSMSGPTDVSSRQLLGSEGLREGLGALAPSRDIPQRLRMATCVVHPIQHFSIFSMLFLSPLQPMFLYIMFSA